MSRKHTVFHRTLRDIRALCPPLLPFKVRRENLDGAFGYCYLCYGPDGTASHFRIGIHKGLDDSVACHFLLHEVAHALAWNEGSDLDDHGEEFGLAYARLYRQVWQS